MITVFFLLLLFGILYRYALGDESYTHTLEDHQVVMEVSERFALCEISRGCGPDVAWF